MKIMTDACNQHLEDHRNDRLNIKTFTSIKAQVENKCPSNVKASMVNTICAAVYAQSSGIDSYTEACLQEVKRVTTEKSVQLDHILMYQGHPCDLKIVLNLP